ncbi:hypothetical protein P691DRAFT_770213, partial [Macrolepiota fuliginosa MF-IS2]
MKETEYDFPSSTEVPVQSSVTRTGDVDFLMEHLNNPNIDLDKSYLASMDLIETDVQ